MVFKVSCCTVSLWTYKFFPNPISLLWRSKLKFLFVECLWVCFLAFEVDFLIFFCRSSSFSILVAWDLATVSFPFPFIYLRRGWCVVLPLTLGWRLYSLPFWPLKSILNYKFLCLLLLVEWAPVSPIVFPLLLLPPVFLLIIEWLLPHLFP